MRRQQLTEVDDLEWPEDDPAYSSSMTEKEWEENYFRLLREKTKLTWDRIDRERALEEMAINLHNLHGPSKARAMTVCRG
jgi:hypothetical protein